MGKERQYVVNERGEKVAVVISIEDMKRSSRSLRISRISVRVTKRGHWVKLQSPWSKLWPRTSEIASEVQSTHLAGGIERPQCHPLAVV
jgi:hypothetical protein